MGNLVKKRSEMKKEYTWATEDMFESDAAWEESYEETVKLVDKTADYNGKIGEAAESLYEYLELTMEINKKFDYLGNYSARKCDEDTANPVYNQMRGRMSLLYTRYGSSTAFATPEMMKLTPEILEKWYTEVPGLKVYERKLNLILAKKEHILSEAEERILALASEIQNGPENIFGMFNNADAKFPDIMDSEGNMVPVTHGSYMRFLTSSDRRVRKDAYNSVYSVYKKYDNTLAAILDAQIKQLTFESKIRKFDNNLAAALSNTEVPEHVYHNLIETVHNNMHYMHRYVGLKKKALKLDKVCMYDIFAPMAEDVAKDIPFEEAKQMVYDALAPLGDDYRRVLKEGFDNRWIDVYENEGKRTGAYSAGAKVHPYVLLNYADNLNSVFTLAHEMGHALHSYYSNKTQHPAYSRYKIFVAEVASTCNEALLMRYLLDRTENKAERIALITQFLDDFRGTLYRQTMFAEFELKINNLVEAGERLTANRLKEIYHELNVLYYGPDMVVDENIDVEWAKIPHFYYNYYVYQYATGYSAAIAISEKILKEGASAVENYLKFLSSGGSADPITLLKIAGVDMSTAEPVNQALSLFGELLDEMEKLLEE